MILIDLPKKLKETTFTMKNLTAVTLILWRNEYHLYIAATYN